MHRARVLLVALTVVIAGGIGTYLLVITHNPGVTPVRPRADGPTLYEALSEDNTSVRNVSGGPWALFSVWGIAAQSPFSANVISYPAQNHTVNSCGQQFNGLRCGTGRCPFSMELSTRERPLSGSLPSSRV